VKEKSKTEINLKKEEHNWKIISEFLWWYSSFFSHLWKSTIKDDGKNLPCTIPSSSSKSFHDLFFNGGALFRRTTVRFCSGKLLLLFFSNRSRTRIFCQHYFFFVSKIPLQLA
jgi:hypothetical protein